MGSTLLEQTRALHEDTERLERLVARDLQQEVKTHRERLYQSHRVRAACDQVLANSHRLAEIYDDKDGSRKDEIAFVAGQGPGSAAGPPNMFSAFYERLNEIRDYHRRHPSARVVERPPDPEELIKEEPYVEFTGEEALGKFVDLNEQYNAFVNSKFGQRDTEYSAYLDSLQETHRIPRNQKFTKAYREYLGSLVAYLSSFFARTQPLQDLPKALRRAEASFVERWDAGQVLGWEDRGGPGAGGEGGSAAQSIVDLDEFDTLEELMDPDLVGPDKMKEALKALGLKTGGTPRERAERLLLTKDTRLEDLDPKHFAKGVVPPKRGKQTAAEAAKAARAQAREIALAEAKVQRLCELVQEAISATKAQVERKAALTTEEIEKEREEVDAVPEEDEDSDEEEGAIYNPLKLPLGWDGKPIPYWLYKLHGLGHEFKCQICGDYSYWGRRAFERHFKEFRHQNGMRSLGIPNTKQFYEVTVIKDAQELWEKIKERQGMTQFKPEVEEEYEDREGNVYDKRTYHDLKRQGLV